MILGVNNLVKIKELEMKNKTISRLRRRKHNRTSSNPAKSARSFLSIEDLPRPPPVKTCLCRGAIRRISEVRQ